MMTTEYTRCGTYIRVQVLWDEVLVSSGTVQCVHGQWIVRNRGGFKTFDNARDAFALVSTLVRGVARHELRSM